MSDPFKRANTKGDVVQEDPMIELNKRWSIIAKNQEMV